MLSNCFDESNGLHAMHTLRPTAATTLTILALAFARPMQGQGAAGQIHGRIVDVATGRGVTIGSVAAMRTGDSTAIAGATPDRKLVVRAYGSRVGSVGARLSKLSAFATGSTELRTTSIDTPNL